MFGGAVPQVHVQGGGETQGSPIAWNQRPDTPRGGRSGAVHLEVVVPWRGSSTEVSRVAFEPDPHQWSHLARGLFVIIPVLEQ